MVTVCPFDVAQLAVGTTSRHDATARAARRRAACRPTIAPTAGSLAGSTKGLLQDGDRSGEAHVDGLAGRSLEGDGDLDRLPRSELGRRLVSLHGVAGIRTAQRGVQGSFARVEQERAPEVAAELTVDPADGRVTEDAVPQRRASRVW